MPDRKPADLTQTDVERETGMVDPYAEAQRAAMNVPPPPPAKRPGGPARPPANREVQ